MLRPTDLAQPSTLPSATELADALTGTGHAVLIHNAAVVGADRSVGSLSPEPLAHAVTVNLTDPDAARRTRFWRRCRTMHQ